MKPLEIVSVFALAITWASYLLPGQWRPKWQIYFPAITALIIVGQIIFERFLVQMALVDIVGAALLLSSIPKIFFKSDDTAKKVTPWRRVLRGTGMGLATSLVVVSIAVPVILPPMPASTGSYKVSMASYEWVDPSRPETFTPDPNDHRDLMVTVWYPAEIASSKNEEIFPALVFSHGWGMSVASYEVQLSDIASHGYVIFGIDHPYEASEVDYPDGRVVTLSPEIVALLKSGKQKEANLLLEQYTAASDPAVKEAYLRQLDALNGGLSANSIKIWTEDTRFVIGKIEEVNQAQTPGILSRHLDRNAMGVFGHSFGGAIAGMTCLEDSRCKAGLNMDGMQFGEYDYAANGSLQQPFMEMASQDLPSGINDFMYDQIDNWTYRLRIIGAKHNNFTDFPLYAPLFRQTPLISGGSIDPIRMKNIVEKYTLAFFDKFLKGADSELLKGADPDFPEVIFQMHGPRT
jgi:predicted dienelactone hydrolase